MLTTRGVNRAAPTSDGERGAVAILTAVIMVIAIILLAFVADRGLVYSAKAQLQDAVDAAALAGVRELCTHGGTADSAVVVATQYAGLNGVEDTPSTLIVTPPYTADGSTSINVRANTYVPSFFGTIIGVKGVAEAAQATATVDCTGRKPYAMFGDTTLDFRGGLLVYGGIYGGTGINTSGAGTNMHVYAAPATVPPTAGPVVSAGTVGDFADGEVQEGAPLIDPVAYATTIGVFDKMDAYRATPDAVTGVTCNNLDEAWFNADPARLAATYIRCAPGNARVTGPLPAGAQVRFIEASGKLTLNGDPLGSTDRPMLFYTPGDIELDNDLNLFGTLYAPNANYTVTGGPHLEVSYGSLILRSFRVNGNGGSINLDSSGSEFGTPASSLLQ